MHLWGNLAPPQTLGENLADVGHVLNGHSEGDRHVQVYRTDEVALRQHLLAELLAELPKVGASVLHRIVVEEFSLSDFAELDDETSDSLEHVAGDGLSDELMPRSIRVGSKLEIAHDLLSVAGVGTPETLGDSPIVVSFVETAGSAVASRMPAVEVVHAVGLNVFRRTSDQDSGEALVATSLVAALEGKGRISVVVHSIILTPSQSHSSDSPLKWGRKIDGANPLSCKGLAPKPGPRFALTPYRPRS